MSVCPYNHLKQRGAKAFLPARREGLGGGLKPAAKNSDPDLSAGSAHLLPKCPVVCASCDARRAPRDGIGWAPGGEIPEWTVSYFLPFFSF